VGNIKHEAVFPQRPASVSGFFHAPRREIDICPTSETVLLVPGAFSMPQENEFFHAVL
jgi:hypothetical protein